MFDNHNIISFLNSSYNYMYNGFKNVSNETKSERLEICKSCEFFNESLYQCKQCGCFLQIKTSWATEKCPIDKWGAEIEVGSSEIPAQSQPSGDCGCKKK